MPPKNPNSKIQLDNPNSVNRQTRFLQGFLLYDGAGQTVLRGTNALKQFRIDYKPPRTSSYWEERIGFLSTKKCFLVSNIMEIAISNSC